MDNDGGFAIDRAFVFADAAPRALLFFNDGPFLVVADNGLVGTLFIADQADLVRIPGDASGFIDVGHPYLNQSFLFKRDRPDCLCGANPPAEIAELLTVSDSRHKPRGVETCKTRFKKGRLERIIGTNFQTLPATRADRDKSFFRQRTRGPNQPVIDLPAFRLKRVGFDHQG